MRLFSVSYTLRGVVVPAAPPRLCSPQVPVHRAFERDQDAVAAWRGDLGEGTKLAALTGAWVCFEDEAGQSLRGRGPRLGTPAGAPRSSGLREHRAPVRRRDGLPQARPAGPVLLPAPRAPQAQGRAPRACPKPTTSHLITAAHHALNAAVILIWDNLNTHRSRKMRAFTDARENWLTVVQLPAYAPDLNAIEGAWSAMKSGLGNHTAPTLDQLEAIVRSRLRAIQRQPDLINALLGQTGLTLEPPPP